MSGIEAFWRTLGDIPIAAWDLVMHVIDSLSAQDVAALGASLAATVIAMGVLFGAVIALILMLF